MALPAASSPSIPSLRYVDVEQPRSAGLADQAIRLWRMAEAVEDAALLEALRPVLMHVARVLAKDIMNEASSEPAQ